MQEKKPAKKKAKKKPTRKATEKDLKKLKGSEGKWAWHQCSGKGGMS